VPYVFPLGTALKKDPVTGKLLGGKYIPPSDEDETSEVEGDPEAAKAVLNGLGLPWMSTMIDQAQAGQNPLSSNVSILAENSVVDTLSTATIGSASNIITSDDAGLITERETTALPLTNELEDFASVNCIFGLGCLSPEELNFPDETYRKTGIRSGQIVLRSGQTPQGKPRTFAEKEYNLDAGYFINNVEIQTVIAPNPKSRATNFHQISFEVTEPYSMGQLLQTMQICSKNAGYSNYLESPWLLQLDFVGQLQTATGNTEIPNMLTSTTKKLPLKLVSVNFNVDTNGSHYSFICSAFNDEAFSDTNQSLPVDITLSGRSLQEAVQTGFNSLSSHLNTHLLNRKKETKEKVEVDEYIFAFPSDTSSVGLQRAFKTASIENTATSGDLQFKEFDDSAIEYAFKSRGGFDDYVQDNSDFGARVIEQKRDYVENRLGYSVKRGKLSESIKKAIASPTVTPNKIGSSKILPNDPLSPGNLNFGLSQFSWNPDNGLLERGGTVINPEVRTITFKAGTKIQKILEELVLLSDFGKKLTKNGVPDKNGFVDWFRIESSVYLINDKKAEAVMGRLPRIYLYKVVPYKVHKSQFMMPNDPPPGYDNLVSQAVKEYNYMYTGKNTDIINFDIKFDNAFYAAVSTDRGNRSGNNDPSEQGNTDVEEGVEVTGNAAGYQGDGLTSANVNRSIGTETAAAMQEDSELQIARQFNEAIVNSDGDLVSIEMEILGDPYYIADSGVGNYNAEATNYTNLNIDGTINHQSSEVDILINFRTPVDIDPETGAYLMDGPGIGVKDFSGLYKVNTVINQFRDNLFTQTLQCVRRRNYQLKDAEAEVQDALYEQKRRYEKRVEEARETGDQDQIDFAIADKNADGKLQVWETQQNPNATDLATGKRGKSVQPTTEESETNAPAGNTTPVPTEQTTTPATTTPPPSRTGGTGSGNNDPYYNYGVRRRNDQ